MEINEVEVPRFDISRATPLIVGVDMGLIVLFVLLGEIAHSINLFETAKTAIPFLAGWWATAPFLGAYSSKTFESPVRIGVFTLGSWVLAAAIAQVLRATSFFPRDNASFDLFLVSVGVAGGFLIAWRLVYYFGLKTD